jgi:hypothetical protein
MRLLVPANITIILLPPKCPELNPVENVWQFMRDNWLSNRVFKSYDDLVDHCCAGNTLVEFVSPGAPWENVHHVVAGNEPNARSGRIRPGTPRFGTPPKKRAPEMAAGAIFRGGPTNTGPLGPPLVFEFFDFFDF